MNKDIEEIFREKNRMILITNLKYDLDKNINSLLDTITNIFNLEFTTAIKNIVSILEDSDIDDSVKIITNFINSINLDLYTEVEKLLVEKKEILEKCIDNLQFNEEQINAYYETVDKTTLDFKDSLKKFLIVEEDLSNFDILNKFILDNVVIDKKGLTLNRIKDYLKNRLYGKLENKLHMEVTIRDSNLINKAKESYLRFQEISMKTIKSNAE